MPWTLPSSVRVGAGGCKATRRGAWRVWEYRGQGYLLRELEERDLARAPGWFWKQKNNLFLKQPDWFALEGL